MRSYDDPANDAVHFWCAFSEVASNKEKDFQCLYECADLASLVGLVFIVVGLDYGHPTALTGAVPAVATVTMSEREHDKDRFGGDYTDFDIKPAAVTVAASERMFTRGGSGRQSRTRPQRL